MTGASVIEVRAHIGLQMGFVNVTDIGAACDWTAHACIVGAGAAGTTLAEALAASGISVCLVESGGFSLDEEVQSLYDLISIGHPQRPGFLSRLRCFGGSCNLWGGRSMELQQLDFEKRPWVPRSGWPIAAREVSRYYRDARKQLNLPAEEDGNREGDFRHLSAAERTFVEDGYLSPSFVLSPSIPKHFGDFYRGKFARSRLIQVLLHANVTNVNLDESGRYVRSVTAKTMSGKTFQVHAQTFILACGGLETPRLLLVSRDKHPAGIGNGYDLVGRFFIDHPRAAFGHVYLAPALSGRFVARQRLRGGRVKLGLQASPAVQRREGLLNHYLHFENKFSVRTQENYAPLIERINLLLMRSHARDLYQVGKGHVKDYLLSLGNVIPETAQRRVNLRRSSRSRTAKERSYIIVYDCEQPPSPSSRVFLSHDVDRLGMNRLVLDWRIDSSVNETMFRLQSLLANTLESKGTGWLEPEEDSPVHSDASHHMGTTRMSVSPRSGVVDPDCRVHGIENLFIASSAVFPTAGHANPTLTIIALTLRLANHLSTRLSGAHGMTGLRSTRSVRLDWPLLEGGADAADGGAARAETDEI